MTAEIQLSFDYSDLDVETCAVVKQRTSEIKALMKRSAQDIIDIGGKLTEVKAHLGHGNFGAWLSSEFDWDERTARRFMGVFDKFKTDNLSDLDIAPSALYLLSSPSVPQEARDEVIEAAEYGERITFSEAKRVIANHQINTTSPTIIEHIKKASPETFEQVRNGELSITEAKRTIKEQAREEVRERNRELVRAAPPVIERVAGVKYQTIVLDPPWDWGDEGDADQFGRARPTYATMTIDQISELPVAELASADSHLYLWITNRSLSKGFALLEKWGFRYVTCLTWCKPSIGMGNYFRGSTEQILFGVRGSLPLLRRDVGTWFSAQRPGAHSSKPEEFYGLVESCSPGPWLEMFARQNRNGWTSWGAEA